MKNKISICVFFLLILNFSTSQSQDFKKNQTLKLVDGSESHDFNSGSVPKFTSTNYPSVQGSTGVYTFHPTGLFTLYDLQSNSVPTQIVQDPVNPMNVHAVFFYSQDPGFATRKSAYLYSENGGNSWLILGDVPATLRTGFPSISLVNQGCALIANHTTGISRSTSLHIDAGPGFGTFMQFVPEEINNITQPLWPRVLGLSNNKVVFIASVQGPTSTSINTFVPPATFTGWQTNTPGSSGEKYSLSKSSDGKVGHAYIGSEDGVNDHDAFYRSSTDDGITWSNSIKVWDWIYGADTLGALSGITMVYGNNNEPYVAFEVCRIGAGGILLGGPSTIRVWCPVINGGEPQIIAGPGNVPYYPNSGNMSDAFLPVCRPSIGKSVLHDYLFVAFEATTGLYGTDSSAYYAAWIAQSLNAGVSWFPPDRMTPKTPLRDWRYVSMSQENQFIFQKLYIQMMCQSDSVAGAYVNGAPIGQAEAVGIKAWIYLGNVNNIGNVIPDKFKLDQNYPNPFNPVTTIRFEIPKQTSVSIKVYNSRGQEVAAAVNNELLSAGIKEVIFDASNLSSGVYYYTLLAGDYKETKKMILIR